MGWAAGNVRVTLGELLAVLSLGIDLGLGQPTEHMLRQCMLAIEFSARLGLDASDREVVQFVGLIAWMGCHTNSYEQAKWFGDDIAFRADSYQVDWTPAALARFSMGKIGSGAPPTRRVRTVAAFMHTGRKQVDPTRAIHCAVAGELAVKLGFSDEVRVALAQLFERWDGKGDPGERSGARIPLPVRIVQLTDVVEIFHRTGGIDAATAVARQRRGTQFDPELVDLLCAHAGDLLAPLGGPISWNSVISAHPRSTRLLYEEETTAALEAIADFTDLKSPFTLGHSRAVADLAAEAGRLYGLPTDQIGLVRTAGLLHDVGRLGISNAIWDKPEPLTPPDWERIRMRPYLTERMLSVSAVLAPLGTLASLDRERLDGSGYPRGLRGDSLSPSARILAAADAYQAMREPRPHRPERAAEEAARELRSDARAGRLDGEAVEAVLRAAGHPGSRRPRRPGGLTSREVEVLRLIARGVPDREIAERLFITRKTVGHHAVHIYAKIGVTNRVAASLYATEHGLLSPQGDSDET